MMRGQAGGSSGTARVPVAIVGVGAILPDAPSAPAYWQNIRSRRYSIGEVPRDRWRVEDYYDPDPTVPDKTYSKIGAWVRDFTFDWKGFRIPPKVAAAMDEGQQWAVAIAAEALGAENTARGTWVYSDGTDRYRVTDRALVGFADLLTLFGTREKAYERWVKLFRVRPLDPYDF